MLAKASRKLFPFFYAVPNLPGLVPASSRTINKGSEPFNFNGSKGLEEAAVGPEIFGGFAVQGSAAPGTGKGATALKSAFEATVYNSLDCDNVTFTG